MNVRKVTIVFITPNPEMAADVARRATELFVSYGPLIYLEITLNPIEEEAEKAKSSEAQP